MLFVRRATATETAKDKALFGTRSLCRASRIVAVPVACAVSYYATPDSLDLVVPPANK